MIGCKAAVKICQVLYRVEIGSLRWYKRELSIGIKQYIKRLAVCLEFACLQVAPFIANCFYIPAFRCCGLLILVKVCLIINI